MKKIVLASIAATALSLTACQGAPAMPDSVEVRTMNDRVITVTGSEEVKAEPDIAEIVYVVSTEDADPGKCQTQNAEKVGQIIALLKGLGIEEKSIQTSGYGLMPNYNWEGDTQTIQGYQMMTEITVSDIPMDEAGKILSQSVEQGVNSIQAVNYMSSQYDEKYQEALKLAIKSAEKKAQIMAEAGSCVISGISHVEEYAQSQEARYSDASTAGMVMEQGQNEQAAPVMPGEIAIRAQVNVDFKISN